MVLLGYATVPAQRQDGPRIPYVSEPPDDPALAKNFSDIRAAGLRVSNMFRVTANSPQMGLAMGAFARSIAAAAKVPRKYLEMSLIRTAQIEGGQYVYAHNLPAAKSCGVSQAQIDALPHWRSSKMFDEKDRAVLAYADAMTHNAGPDEGTFQTLLSFFTPQEVLQITMANAFYTMEARYGTAMRIPIEKELDTEKVTGGC